MQLRKLKFHTDINYFCLMGDHEANKSKQIKFILLDIFIGFVEIYTFTSLYYGFCVHVCFFYYTKIDVLFLQLDKNTPTHNSIISNTIEKWRPVEVFNSLMIDVWVFDSAAFLRFKLFVYKSANLPPHLHHFLRTFPIIYNKSIRPNPTHPPQNRNLEHGIW